MTFLSKMFLFIISYLPLFIIFIIIDFENISRIFPYLYFSHHYIIWFLIVVIILALFYILWLFYIFKRFLKDEDPWIIENIENSNHEILAYLFAYVIPFLWMPNEKKILITIILLLVSFTVFIKSDLIKYNFVLLLFWFDIIKIELNWGRKIFIFKKHSREIKKWDSIRYWKIANNLYLLK